MGLRVAEGVWEGIRVGVNTVGKDGVPEPRNWFGAAVVRDRKRREKIFLHGGLSEKNEQFGGSVAIDN